MKIVLEAFCGKLKSEMIDWPENTPPHIFMMVDMPKYKIDIKGVMVPDMITTKKGEFEWSGHWYNYGGHSAKRYVLIGIS